MSIFDRLLETDAEKLQEKEKTELKIKRLSDIVGEPFVVTCAALTEDQMVHVSEISKGIKLSSYVVPRGDRE